MKFEIKTLERWETDVWYTVEAKSLEEAVQAIRDGDVAYDRHEHGIGEDEFIKVIGVSASVDAFMQEGS